MKFCVQIVRNDQKRRKKNHQKACFAVVLRRMSVFKNERKKMNRTDYKNDCLQKSEKDEQKRL